MGDRPRGRAILAGFALVGVAFLLIPAAASAKPVKPRTVVVEARDNEFDAESVTVPKGTRVRFVNVGRNDHNVIPNSLDDEFLHIRTSRLEPDESVVVSMNETGKYRYYCELHGTRAAGMRGVITVKD